jgi:hypothetical protein
MSFQIFTKMKLQNSQNRIARKDSEINSE